MVQKKAKWVSLEKQLFKIINGTKGIHQYVPIILRQQGFTLL